MLLCYSHVVKKQWIYRSNFYLLPAFNSPVCLIDLKGYVSINKTNTARIHSCAWKVTLWLPPPYKTLPALKLHPSIFWKWSQECACSCTILGSSGRDREPGKGHSDREHRQGDLPKDLVVPNVTKIKSKLSCDCSSLPISSHSADIKTERK